MKKALSLILAQIMTVMVIPFYVVFAAAPTNVDYEFYNEKSGLTNGKITVELPENHGATNLAIYFGNSEGKLQGYTKLASVKIPTGAKQVVFEMPQNVMIPPSATKLLVYSEKNGTEETEFTAFDLPNDSAYVLEGDAPISEFFVLSDLHYGRNADCDRQAKTALNYIAANASNIDGIFVVGDAIQGGSVGSGGSTEAKQYKSLNSMLKAITGLPKIYPAVGNHESFGWYTGENSDNEGYMKAFADNLRAHYTHIGISEDWNNPYYSVQIKDFTFIVLGPTKVTSSTEGYLGDEQINWLKDQLEALEDDRPVFIMLHQPMKNSVAQLIADGSDEWADILDGDKLKSVLKKYPNVVLFNGHTHYSLTEDANKHMVGGGDEFAVFNTASVKDNEQGLCVSVYKDKIIVQGIDFSSGDLITSAQFVLSERYTGPQEEPNTQLPSDDNVTVDKSPNKGCGGSVFGSGAIIFCTVISAISVRKKRKKMK